MSSEYSTLIPRPPQISRQDTDSYLSYYSSPLADVGVGPYSDVSTGSHAQARSRAKQLSLNSTSDSASDYSSPDSPSAADTTNSNPVRRRPSQNAGVASDRRRLAIVETRTKGSTGGRDSKRQERSDKPKSQREKAASMSSFAIIAPPDAAPRTYKDLTPPPESTVPKHSRSTTSYDNPSSNNAIHHRSASEIPRDSEFAREIVRKVSKQLDNHSEIALSLPRGREPACSPKSPDALKPPVATMSRSSSPGGVSDASDSSVPTRSRSALRLLTPEIGQSKAIHDPVAAPVITKVEFGGSPPEVNTPSTRPSSYSPTPPSSSPAPSFSPDNPKDYIRYQPGVHSLAGPLPAPPTPSSIMSGLPPGSPPPRPPRLHSPPPPRRRDLEAVRQALQLPPSVSERLSRQSTTSADDVAELSRSARSAHAREGAFPPSRFISQPDRTSPAHSNSDDHQPNQQITQDSNLADHCSPPDDIITIIKAQPKVDEPSIDGSVTTESLAIPVLRRESSWVSIQSDVKSDASSYEPQEQRSVSALSEGRSPSPPRKGSISSPLRRDFALPSLPRHHASSSQVHLSSPEPAPRRFLRPPMKKKLASPNAMFFADVLSRKTALERSIAYAHKINELWMCDCGLEDWLHFARSSYRLSRPAGSSSNPFTPQPRHSSRSSMMSEVTFPRRPDATVATDLSRVPSSSEASPLTSPPPLPYPSLVQPQSSPAMRSNTLALPQASSARMHTPVTPLSAKSINFFASLGRKASTRKTDRPPHLPPLPLHSSPKVLVKSPSVIRPVMSSKAPVPSAPSIPGGPRALPNRVIRSQTVIISSPFNAKVAGSQSDSGDHTMVNRRPSLFTKSTSSPPERQSHNSSTNVPFSMWQNPEFKRQVDKLADLLPQANREVLAGYLYRSGQDILAIGQYLEDEKNGTIKR